MNVSPAERSQRGGPNRSAFLSTIFGSSKAKDVCTNLRAVGLRLATENKLARLCRLRTSAGRAGDVLAAKGAAVPWSRSPLREPNAVPFIAETADEAYLVRSGGQRISSNLL